MTKQAFKVRNPDKRRAQGWTDPDTSAETLIQPGKTVDAELEPEFAKRLKGEGFTVTEEKAPAKRGKAAE